jgi:hypothetical protein
VTLAAEVPLAAATGAGEAPAAKKPASRSRRPRKPKAPMKLPDRRVSPGKTAAETKKPRPVSRLFINAVGALLRRQSALGFGQPCAQCGSGINVDQLRGVFGEFDSLYAAKLAL